MKPVILSIRLTSASLFSFMSFYIFVCDRDAFSCKNFANICSSRVTETIKTLNGRLDSVIEKKETLEADLKERASVSRDFVAKMNLLKPELASLQKEIELFNKLVMDINFALH